ncbi:serine/threonine protein kinase [Dictyobacter kobayashii]|uniref:non-specific serine/threonine protein kinase n=1 Tax=Dictyobacter kobayashii TaxID=2014872 RepID=A0A402ACW9_9CHLR|nr:serine/threonine-protein kinase [Dictyobacter kobayashii]GCE16934.1 hypothetical protein KDK_07340 [Dictyobacter kobayashii]
MLQLLRSRAPGGRVGEQKPGQLASGPCSEQEVLSWLLPLMDALQELHSRRPPVMHRDIKPGNIVLTPNNTAVLLDFGLTKLYDPDASTQTLGRAVTEGFSPLEQYIGKTSPQSDIYSLGATMYILLTNRLPPVATSRSVRDELIAPRLLNPSISPNVEWVLLKALSLHADERFQSMGDLARILREPSFDAYNDQTVAVQMGPAGPIVTSQPPSQLQSYAGTPYEPTVAASTSSNAMPPGPVSSPHQVLAPQAYNRGPYSPIPPQQSYGYGAGSNPQQMSYPGQPPFPPGQGYMGPALPGTPAYPYPNPTPIAPPLSPAEQKKRARAQAAQNRPLPTPSSQGCLWGLIQGCMAVFMVLALKESADFYLATVLGFLFYVLSGYMTTRRGGGSLRGAWAGYWAGIWSTIVFWVGILLGLLISATQRYQTLITYNPQNDPRELFSQAWSFVQPHWPAVPMLLAKQTPFVNFLFLMLLGLIVAWVLGLLGGLWGNAHMQESRRV